MHRAAEKVRAKAPRERAIEGLLRSLSYLNEYLDNCNITDGSETIYASSFDLARILQISAEAIEILEWAFT